MFASFASAHLAFQAAMGRLPHTSLLRRWSVSLVCRPSSKISETISPLRCMRDFCFASSLTVERALIVVDSSRILANVCPVRSAHLALRAACGRLPRAFPCAGGQWRMWLAWPSRFSELLPTCRGPAPRRQKAISPCLHGLKSKLSTSKHPIRF